MLISNEASVRSTQQITQPNDVAGILLLPLVTTENYFKEKVNSNKRPKRYRLKINIMSNLKIKR